MHRNPLPLSARAPLLEPVYRVAPSSRTKRANKIAVIGAGNVGMAIAQNIILRELADELVIVDNKPQKLRGETLDLRHASVFLPPTKINASVDFAATAGSDLCIVAAGARQIPRESRAKMLQRNRALFEEIIPLLVRYSPNSILLIASNPMDALTHLAWKLSGFSPSRVIGSGTDLESSRFCFHIANHLGLDAQDVQAYIVGEQGGITTAFWPSISAGGVPITSLMGRETLNNIFKEVMESGREVVNLKGYTSSAIGFSVASLARSILRDEREIHTISVLAQGFYGLDGEVFLSLPVLLGREGVLGALCVHLPEEDAQKIRETLKKIYPSV